MPTTTQQALIDRFGLVELVQLTNPTDPAATQSTEIKPHVLYEQEGCGLT